MVMMFGQLSDSLVKILETIINDQEIAKYLTYNISSPLAQPNITLPAKSMMFNTVYPFPFDPTVQVTDSSQIRVYLPYADMDTSGNVSNVRVHFDIVVAKSLWLTNDNSRSAIRPYELSKRIISLFRGSHNLANVGRLEFQRFLHLNVNSQYDAVRLIAEMFVIGTG